MPSHTHIHTHTLSLFCHGAHCLHFHTQVLSDEIGEMDARRAFLPELAARKKDYQHDHGKFKLLIEQLVSHQSMLMTKKTDRTAEVRSLTHTLFATPFYPQPSTPRCLCRCTCVLLTLFNTDRNRSL